MGWPVKGLMDGAAGAGSAASATPWARMAKAIQVSRCAGLKDWNLDMLLSNHFLGAGLVAAPVGTGAGGSSCRR